MLKISIAVFTFCGIACIFAVQPKCEKLMECLRQANDEMLKCSTKIDAIDLSKLKGGEFEQCSTSKFSFKKP